MKFYLGAYAASPAWSNWDSQAESDYYQNLAQFEGLAGLEIPFCGSVHPHDDDWFLNNLNPNWDYVFTCIPGTMDRIKLDPYFGIASADDAGRQAALEFLKSARQSIAKINSAAGRRAVQGIEIQTAPARSKGQSNIEALSASLSEILSWDWHGCQVMIEHCDAFTPKHTPAKGFLSLEDEITAVERLIPATGKLDDLGFVINWARSAIESRNIATVAEHCSALIDRELLRGFMFSGVADAGESPYGVWQDTHMPPPLSVYGRSIASTSLLTQEQIVKCAEQVKSAIEFCGLKISIREPNLSAHDRIDCLRQAFKFVQSAF